MFSPPNGLQRDEFLLAPYAMATRHSRGRRVPEPDHPFRPLFQRDELIVLSDDGREAFRMSTPAYIPK